jgi:hypothetical protein
LFFSRFRAKHEPGGIAEQVRDKEHHDDETKQDEH